MGQPEHIPGITGNIAPQNLSDYLGWFSGAARDKAQFVADRLPPGSGEQRLIVDIGSCGGDVAAALAAMLPNDEVEGIDAGEAFVREARQKYPHINFWHRDARDLPYDDETVDAFSSLSVLHEVYSYNDFSSQAAEDALREMYRCLKIGGLVVVREPAKPPEPDERLAIAFPGREIEVPSDADILNADLTSLSSAALMKRMLLQFAPASEYASAILREDGDRLSYELPAWLVAEFLRKRTLVETPDYWEAELEEQYGVFTVEELKGTSARLGFSAAWSIIENVHEAGFYGDLQPGEGIEIRNMQGEPVEQSSRLPSHLYAVLAKEDRAPAGQI